MCGRLTIDECSPLSFPAPFDSLCTACHSQLHPTYCTFPTTGTGVHRRNLIGLCCPVWNVEPFPEVTMAYVHSCICDDAIKSSPGRRLGRSLSVLLFTNVLSARPGASCQRDVLWSKEQHQKTATQWRQLNFSTHESCVAA